MSEQKGKMLILVSPSGGGKSTMANKLLKDFDNIKFSVSATTRNPRPGETDGQHYHFLSDKEFEEKIQNDEFLEWEEFYNGTKYGTLRSAVEKELNKGYFILLDIDVLGALNVKKMFGEEVLAIFLAPPSIEVLEQRLKARGTEDDKTLQTRLKRAAKEMKYKNHFDKYIINNDLESAYNEIRETVSTFINHT